MTTEQIRQEFQLDYGINNLQFDEREMPVFWFEDLLSIINTLAPDFAPHFTDRKYEESMRLVSVTCGSANVPNKFIGVCFIGTSLGNGKVVEDENKAATVAASRALRRYMKSINFDAYQAHLDARNNKQFTPKVESETAQMERLQKSIHALRDALDLDDLTYRYHLSKATANAGSDGPSSTKLMSLEQLILVQTFLSGIKEGIAAEQRKVIA